MPTVRLTGSVKGGDDPSRKKRAKLLYRLFSAGWDIYNGNGDQNISLHNIQKKIVESDAFIFTPGASLEDMFQAASIFVGYQTKDRDLEGKCAIIQNPKGSWTPLLELIEHLNKMGTVKQHYHTFFTVVKRAREVLQSLKDTRAPSIHVPHAEPDVLMGYTEETLRNHIPKPDFNVCVFCSASTSKETYLTQGYTLGKALANVGWGCVSGAGSTGIMGQVVKGSADNGGWCAGSNIPHIIKMEGLPDGLCEFWERSDIYTRMEVMLEESDAFVIMPGGMGTVQELLALIILKQQQNDIMKDKRIVIVNQQEGNGQRFWQPLIHILETYGALSDVIIVDTADDVIPSLKAQ